MRIAVLVHAFPVLSETFIVRQITGLIDRGHQVDVFAGHADDTGVSHPSVERYELMDRTFYRRWIREDYHSHDRSCYRRWLPDEESYSYDIIHCHFGPMGVTGTVLRMEGLFLGKLVTSFHGFDLTAFPGDAGSDVYDGLFRAGDLFTANSTFSENKLLDLGCPQSKLLKLPVGLDPSRYAYRPRYRDPAKPVQILTVARLVEKKGIEYAIRAVAKTAEQHPELRYRVVGDGPLRKSLEDLVRDLALEEKVDLLGWQPEDVVQRLYEDSSIFLLPSVTAENGDHEGLGLVLLEAQAVGLPVVSTLHNGIPEAVIGGKSGFLVPERDVEALANKLTELIDNPSLWTSMGRAGRAHVERCYDIAHLNDRLVDVYRSML